MRRFGALALVGVACGGSEPSLDDPVDTYEAAPVDEEGRSCVVGDVSLVEDLAAVPPGFERAPADLLDQVTGDFLGDVVLVQLETDALADAERTGPGVFEVDDHVVEVRLVTAYWTGTDEVCGAWYEVPFAAALASGDGLLDEVFSAKLVVAPHGDPTFEIAIPARQLRGTLRPETDPDATSLVVTGYFTPAGPDGTGLASPAWAGALRWCVDDGAATTLSDLGDFWFVDERAL